VERSTNPEELIAAASAGCYTMSLADLLSNEGHPPADLQTRARIRLEQTDAGFRITGIELRTSGEVPGVDQRQFAALAEQAKATCPVSLALAGTEITVEATKTG
jgi:osmotically inducible protein OsmC